jgi:hypothetical protein
MKIISTTIRPVNLAREIEVNRAQFQNASVRIREIRVLLP